MNLHLSIHMLCTHIKPGPLLRGLELSYRVTFMPPAKTHVSEQERPSSKSLLLDPEADGFASGFMVKWGCNKAHWEALPFLVLRSVGRSLGLPPVQI
jgi:hypothetical protein